MTGLPYQQSLSELQTKLDAAIKECELSAIPAHMVRNCPSDLQRRDQAWRERKGLEYQIRELIKTNEKTS